MANDRTGPALTDDAAFVDLAELLSDYIEERGAEWFRSDEKRRAMSRLRDAIEVMEHAVESDLRVLKDRGSS